MSIIIGVVGFTVLSLAVLRFGDPQWNRLVYIFQAYVSPRYEGKYGLEDGFIRWPDGFTGTWNTWYRNGRRRSQIHLLNGKYSGIYQTWYPSGQKKGEIPFSEDKIEGRHISWDEDGSEMDNILYKEDTPIGFARHFGSTTGIIQEGTWTPKGRSGRWLWKTKDGDTIAEGDYSDGKEFSGSFLDWHIDQEHLIGAIDYSQGGLRAVINVFKNGRPEEGTIKIWENDNISRIETYRHGERIQVIDSPLSGSAQPEATVDAKTPRATEP